MQSRQGSIVNEAVMPKKRGVPTSNDQKRWFNAVAKGDIATVKTLLSKKRDILHIRNGENDTALHLAVKHRQAAIVQYLLGEGADANLQGKDSRFILQDAAWAGNAAIVSLLIPFIHNIDDRNGINELTPFQHAIAAGHIEAAKLLLNAGADIETRHYQSTSLHTAVTNNQKEATHFLMEHGADIEARGDEGNTPLGSAVIFAYVDPLTALLEHGADIHAKQQSGQSLFALALNKKHFFETFDGSCIRKLLEAGATVTPEEDRHYPFLCDGINKGYPEDILVSLVKSGISIDRKDDEGYTLLLNAIRSGREDLAIALIKAGATADILLPEGFKALFWAKIKKQWNVITAITEQGGIMAALAAVMLGRVDLLEKMKGLDVNGLDCRNDTLLHHAVRWNKLEVVRWLLARGANPNLKNKLGVTPLHKAIFHKNPALIKELLRSGADVNILTDGGKDALTLLSENHFSFYYQPHTGKYS